MIPPITVPGKIWYTTKGGIVGMEELEVSAIFSNGTLRADYGERGDNWGLLERIKIKHLCECSWQKGQVLGYKLYQDESLFYPFAIPSPHTDNKVVGTLLRWQNYDAFPDALKVFERV
jgi:hypothetical protein